MAKTSTQGTLRRLFLAVAVGGLLLGSHGALAQETPAAPIEILDPRPNGIVRSDTPPVVVLARPEIDPSKYFALGVSVRIGDKLLAKGCFPGTCQVFLQRITAGNRTPVIRVSLGAQLFVAPASTSDPQGTTGQAYKTFGEAAARLGRLGAGTHTATVTVWGVGGGTSTAIGSAEVSFTIGAPRTSIVYDNRVPQARIFEPAGGDRPLTTNRGGLIQQNERKVDASSASKVTGRLLLVKDEEEIAATLQRQIRVMCSFGTPKGSTSRDCTTSGLVFIDEITPDFADWDAATVADRGRPGPGTRLARAMKMLDVKSPWGFTWASRVHMYLSPTVMLDVATGSTSPRDYTQIGPAFARSGGIWMEMYRGSAGYGARAFTEAEWRTAPAGVNALVKKYGGSTSQLHYLITRAPRVQKVEDRFGIPCASPMACQWALGEETSLGRQIMNNGVGAYRVSDQATAWLREYNRRFTD